ncbi:MAG: hypothetical protein ABI591_30670 [Kofleriaceae bacterium]
MMRWLAVVCVVGCGGNDPVMPAVDANLDALGAFVACSAQLTGNFVEAITTATSCAQFATTDGGAPVLHLQLASTNLVDPYELDFEISQVAGDYSSQTVMAWSSMATRTLAHDDCLLAAGDRFVPHGDFTLHLASAVPAHGTLVLDQPVHATAFSNCGTPLIEHVEVTF